jgi:hypothetical protein
VNKTLATLLNENHFVPVVQKGQVTLAKTAYDAESGCYDYDESETTQEDLEKVGFLEGWLEEHPEGSDRGGYVPTVFFKNGQSSYYHENAGEWYER